MMVMTLRVTSVEPLDSENARRLGTVAYGFAA
jgi:hypothetical protein